MLYFVPCNYYAWGIYYRPSLFEENGWTPPTTLDELKTLAAAMQEAGITPFAFGNDGRWPAMGTFDQLNFRLNGYQFHMDLMAGKESWTDDRVKNVFALWTELLPLASGGPERPYLARSRRHRGRQDLGHDDASAPSSGSSSRADQQDDLDFFVWPELNPEFGTGTVEAPIDGFLMAKSPKNRGSRQGDALPHGHRRGAEGLSRVDPSAVATANDVDPSGYTALQMKVLEAVSSAPK